MDSKQMRRVLFFVPSHKTSGGSARAGMETRPYTPFYYSLFPDNYMGLAGQARNDV
jgi:hypothetical protein